MHIIKGRKCGLFGLWLGTQRDIDNQGTWERDWCIHFFCKKEHWIWGRKTEEYESVLEYFGLGPLFLLVWSRWWKV